MLVLLCGELVNAEMRKRDKTDLYLRAAHARVGGCTRLVRSAEKTRSVFGRNLSGSKRRTETRFQIHSRNLKSFRNAHLANRLKINETNLCWLKQAMRTAAGKRAWGAGRDAAVATSTAMAGRFPHCSRHGVLLFSTSEATGPLGSSSAAWSCPTGFSFLPGTRAHRFPLHARTCICPMAFLMMMIVW